MAMTLRAPRSGAARPVMRWILPVAFFCAMQSLAVAQDSFPSRTIKFVVPLPPGAHC